ncbi:hypothetical protein Q428_04720 [Fervidicella metallireducens AeB]|uniref:Uncharacterized protein n=1 Tax=Fervidicella metallireducens AeB TaxID=1403537 RepID=A0A017RWH0_9CLOT|nr:ABC-2 transporter permease [Fervidicella metallireducens]EYE89012.1 hypothetical protein Q428_04720 [Fervidicella metallireducens AeB]
MLNLILKDILIQKKSLFIGFVYSLFVFLIFKTNTFPQENGKFIFGAVSIAYIFATYSIEYDEKNNCHWILNSLPLRRKEIVLAKYISLVIYNVIGISMMLITGRILSIIGFNLGNYVVDLKSILYVFQSTFLAFSFFYPIYFKISYSKTRYINTIVYLTVVFLPSFFDFLFKNMEGISNLKFLFEMTLNKWDITQQSMLLAFIIAFTVISVFISIRNYSEKNF